MRPMIAMTALPAAAFAAAQSHRVRGNPQQLGSTSGHVYRHRRCRGGQRGASFQVAVDPDASGRGDRRGRGDLAAPMPRAPIAANKPVRGILLHATLCEQNRRVAILTAAVLVLTITQ